MKKHIFRALTMVAALLPGLAAAQAPHFIAGYELGGRLADVEDRLIPGSIIPVRFLESLKTAEVAVPPGFKTGIIHYATCQQPARVVRLKFKYRDASRKFYDQLLKRYRDRFGKPHEWRGDPFHITIAWKWQFTDPDGNDISLVLQHNTKDEEEKQGNSVKMTMWNLVEKEDACFEQRRPQSLKKKAPEAADPDWDLLVPR